MQVTANTSTTNAVSQQQKSTLMSLVAHALCICLQSTTSISPVTPNKRIQQNLKAADTDVIQRRK
jgi:hypothetical protein